MRHESALFCLLVLLAAGAQLLGGGIPTDAAPAGPPVVRTEGTIASVEADDLVITTAGGRTQVKTAAEMRVLRRVPVKLEDIKAGDFIAAAARKEGDGSLTAVDIKIFPASLKGQIRDGQFPEACNIMTNAVVTETVSQVSGGTVSLAYKDGTAKINVPPTTKISRLEVSTRSDLRAGMRVSIRGTSNADGSLTATSIEFEEGR